MVTKFTSTELDTDSNTVVKIGNFFIRKDSETSITVFNITKDFDLETGDISKLPSMSFTNLLPEKIILGPMNLVEVGSGGAGKTVGVTSFNSCSSFAAGGAGGCS